MNLYINFYQIIQNLFVEHDSYNGITLDLKDMIYNYSLKIKQGLSGNHDSYDGITYHLVLSTCWRLKVLFCDRTDQLVLK